MRGVRQKVIMAWVRHADMYQGSIAAYAVQLPNDAEVEVSGFPYMLKNVIEHYFLNAGVLPRPRQLFQIDYHVGMAMRFDVDVQPALKPLVPTSEVQADALSLSLSLSLSLILCASL